MDHATLDRFAAMTVKASAPPVADIEGLGPHERLAYSRVRRRGWLLEQEKIPYDFAVSALVRIVSR
jgi:hypothetical protein